MTQIGTLLSPECHGRAELSLGCPDQIFEDLDPSELHGYRVPPDTQVFFLDHVRLSALWSHGLWPDYLCM
jgi:hypothetical protein